LFPDPVVLSSSSGTESSAGIGTCGIGNPSRVAIFGLGLIGGSVAMALRSRCPKTEIAIWGRNPSQLEQIREQKLADSVHSEAAEAVGGADLVILCTPVGAMEELAALIAPHLASSAVVTDAGSVKASVVEKLSPLFGARFVGAHPMAGSERSGLSAARADLFIGAPCILTPLEATAPEAVQQVASFWSALGARITMMSPTEHDRIVARLSHLPHALAFALVNLVAGTLPEGAALLAGGSFRDATRVAASDPRLWSGILLENRGEVAPALREISEQLLLLAKNLESKKSDSLLDFLNRAKEYRDSFPLPLPEDIS
jgi:cyclohexadieny/prephenate dehydrogenase